MLREQLQQSNDNLELFTERLAELELAIEDQGWKRLVNGETGEFSKTALNAIAYDARLYYLKNPLINHGVNVQRNYVLGQGVEVTMNENPEANEVVQKFWKDPKNMAELTGHQAMGLKEVDLQLNGNLFLVFFVDPKDDGMVRVRSIKLEQIDRVICNPEDDREPWFYRRTWTQETLDGERKERIAYYPDILHTKTEHMGGEHPSDAHPTTSFKDGLIEWDTPILHVKVGGTGDMKFGVPEVYAALDWAQAVKVDMENYATVKAALARFAFQMTRKGGQKAIDAAKAKLQTTIGSGSGYLENNPAPQTGGVFIGGERDMLAPVRTAGAQPSPEEGRSLRLMVAAALGIPETILMGDADVGNLATSKTLDRPTELKFRDRQTLWADTLRSVLKFVLKKAVEFGDLKDPDPDVVDATEAFPFTPKEQPNPQTGEMEQPEHEEPKDFDAALEINFPPILEHDPETLVGSIVQANGLSMIPEREMARLLMQTFGLAHIDELLDQMFDKDTGERLEPLDPMGMALQNGLPGGPPPPWGKPAPKGGSSASPFGGGSKPKMLRESLREAVRELKNG